MWFLGNMPRIMHQEVRPKRAYLYYAAIYLISISAGIEILYRFHEPLVWYRTPLIFIAAVLGVIWEVISQRTNVRNHNRTQGRS